MEKILKAVTYWYTYCPTPRLWRFVTDKLEAASAKGYKE